MDGLLFPRRLPHQPKIDMDFIFDEVMAKRLPLDRQRIAESPYDVRIVLSDVEACRPVVVQLRSVADRADEYLKAGAWLPILAGPPYLLNGRTYLDGGVLRPDPLYAALAEGCTHVLMLNTVPEGQRTTSRRCQPRCCALSSTAGGLSSVTPTWPGGHRGRRTRPGCAAGPT